MTRGDLTNASRFATRLLRIAEPLGIAELEVAGHMIVGSASITAAPCTEACEHIARAIELAQTATLPPPASTFDFDVLATAHATHSVPLALTGQLDAAREQIERSLERSDSIGHLHTRGTTLFTSSACCYFLDDPDGPWSWPTWRSTRSGTGTSTPSSRRRSSSAGGAG